MKNSPRFKELSAATTDKIDSQESDYLYVQESGVPGAGNGLFTAIPIYRDEVISIFKGKVLSAEAAASGAANGADGYFINLPDGTILDSMTVHCFAKYANDASGFVKTDRKNNAKITLDEDGAVCIVASRIIQAGEEILCGYGKKYWQKYATKPFSKQVKPSHNLM